MQDWPEVVSHAHDVTFRMAEVAVPRQTLAKILSLIPAAGAARTGTRGPE